MRSTAQSLTADQPEPGVAQRVTPLFREPVNLSASTLVGLMLVAVLLQMAILVAPTRSLPIAASPLPPPALLVEREMALLSPLTPPKPPAPDATPQDPGPAVPAALIVPMSPAERQPQGTTEPLPLPYQPVIEAPAEPAPAIEVVTPETPPDPPTLLALLLPRPELVPPPEPDLVITTALPVLPPLAPPDPRAEQLEKLRRKIHFQPTTRDDCLPPQLLHVLYDIAENFGEVRISSTHRDPLRNRRVGGARNSFHLECRAIDFIRTGNRKAILQFIQNHPDVGGYKLYPRGHFHIDDGQRRSW